MSSMGTIDKSHSQRMLLQAAIDLNQLELEKCKKNVAELEAQVLAIEDGEQGNLNRLALFINATTDMDTLKNLSDRLLKNVGTLLNDSVQFQSTLHDHLLDQVKTLSEIDKRGPQKDGKTFQQKFDEASAKVKKQAEGEIDSNGAR